MRFYGSNSHYVISAADESAEMLLNRFIRYIRSVILLTKMTEQNMRRAVFYEFRREFSAVVVGKMPYR